MPAEASEGSGRKARHRFSAFCDQAVRCKHQGRHHGKNTEETDQHAFCKHDPQISPNPEAHKCKHQKSGDCRHRAAKHRAERKRKSAGHRFLVVHSFRLCLTILLHHHDRIIHGQDQLKKSSNRMGRHGHAPEKKIRPGIDRDRQPGRSHIEQRFHIGWRHDKQNSQNNDKCGYDDPQRERIRGAAVQVINHAAVILVM